MNWIKNKYQSLMNIPNMILLLLEVTFKIIFVLLLLPAMNLALDYVMGLWGQSYITAANLPSFLTFPPAVLLFIVSAAVIGLYVLFKMTTMVTYCCSFSKEIRPNIPDIFFTGYRKAVEILRDGRLIPIVYSLFFYIVYNLLIFIGITVYMRIPAGYWQGASDRFFIKGLIILVLIFVGIIGFRRIFAFHFCICLRQDFQSGIKNSKILLKGRTVKPAVKLLFFNLGLSLVFFAAYYIILFICALLVYIFTEKYLVISIFLSFYPKINFYAIIIADMITFITNLNIISTQFLVYLPKERLTERPIQQIKKPFHEAAANQKHILIGILFLVISFGCLNFYHAVRNDSFYLQKSLSGIQITSHRGNSLIAPENTLPAIEQAIEAHADCVEIDVQQALDGTVVLLHDRSLLRTAGLKSDIQSLTYKEIRALDAGGWFNSDYVNTPIPTLEEAFILCKGKIKLNIDVKAYGQEKNLEEALVILINQYGLERNCTVSSSRYESLVRIKNLNPNIKTGLILSAAYGNIYDKEYIDFYSIRSVYITKYVVNSAHRAGKEVHAWTVNQIGEIERMKAFGVDCIITDNTILAREVLYRDDTNKTFLQLLNRMLNNRSFYQLVETKKK